MDNTRTEESSCMESDCDTPTSPEPLQEDELFILHNKSVQYKVLEFIGEGGFGKVAKCVNMNTNENTAIKILKDVNNYAKEVKMLEKLRTLDPEKNNLVRFMDSFIVDDKSCIAFECLDRSLLDLMVQREERYTLNEIRPITSQLLVALNALKGIGLLHADLKLDNVMLVNHQDEPFRVKLIDFGVALPASDVEEGMIAQPYAYRAPEVSLGLPISAAIDMWSLGCVLACLFLCQNIFNGESSYDVMNTICCLLGQPQDHLLDAGKNTHQYFKRERCNPNSRWRLKTPEEYKKENDDQLQLSEWEFDYIRNLADAVDIFSNAIDEVEVEDTKAFSNLLQMLLNPDAEMRITPEEALEHSFVTMSHLADYAHRSSYTQAAFELMVVCPACDSDECHEYLSDFESNTESSDSGEVFSHVDNSGTEESYCMGSNCDTPTSPEPLQEDELFILHNKSVQYKVLEFIGEGGFGKVAKCVNMNTNENTAIKILKDVNNYAKEVKMLEKLRTLDPEKNNLVRFMDSFIVDDKSCIAFECLDRSLLDLMVQREERYTLNEIRPITRQLLVALNALKGIGLLHADLKLDNVMLVNHQDEPFRVKLIDFGVALPASDVEEGMIAQPYAYRAPEVSLGLPISAAIDMWSLGCVLACLFLCQNIFNGESSYDVMNTICCLLGQPQDHLLDAGKNTHQYFKSERCSPNSRWRLKTPEEYKKENDDQLQLSEWEFDYIRNLADAVDIFSNAIDEVEVEDTKAFSNLLQMLLNPDAEMRITPEEALEHSFVTMSHLADDAHRSSYTQAAFDLMVVCPACDSDECHEYLSDFESNTESSDSGEVFSNMDNSSSEESSCMESNCESPTSPGPLQEKELFILHNKSVQYKVLEFIGEGSFGKVAKCVNLKTNENRAVKILKDGNDYAEEVEMLEKLRNLDPERNNLVRFMDSFIVDDKSCIAFECLDRSLWDLMLQREERLTLNEIRPITHQLLVALNALKGIGLLYTDLKHDNVMLVNHQDEPFRVKLIDFGLAMPASKVWEGMIAQPCAYRAPEVSLGLPISEAIDMWSLGCLMATLFFCKDIFKGESSYDVMKTICCLLGQPQDHLLDAGKNTHRYFKRNRCTPNSRWRLKTPEEYDDQLQLSQWDFDQIGNLADAVDIHSNAIEEVEVEDTRAFLNLLQMLLNSDAEMRITPEEALEHSFVTMSHLADYAHRSSYTQAAFELMVVCPACDSDECHEYLSDFESNTESSDSGEVFSNMDNSSSEESSCMESDCETPSSPEPLHEKELFILHNKSVQYKVLEFIGEGSFGKVAKCVNMNTNETTAVKIIKDVNDFAEEVKMLQKLRTLDPERNNLVRFMDSFIVDDMFCIAFELLDRSLWDLMLQRKKRLTLNEIRPITRQLLVALNALKGIGLLYTDLKLDNVMLVNHQDEPFRVKLIDFGLAMTASEVWEGMIVQPCAYRAPEVSLGLPISEAIDMWSLGCLLATLFFCKNIFKGESSYDVMKTICCLLGQPQDHLLDAGKYTHRYFKRNFCSPNSQWRLKTTEEYDDQLQLSQWEFNHIRNLADAVHIYSNAIEEVEVEDTRAFLNLLQMLLNPDAEMRITPEEALEHSFVTMSHLADFAHRSSYTQAAIDLMVVCPACDSDKCHRYLSDFESNMESTAPSPELPWFGVTSCSIL